MRTRFLDTSSRIVVWTVRLWLDQCRKVFRENQEMCTLKIVMINVKHKISKIEMISTNVHNFKKKVKVRITIICYNTSFQWANWRKLYNQNCLELVWNNRLYKVNLNLLKKIFHLFVQKRAVLAFILHLRLFFWKAKFTVYLSRGKQAFNCVAKSNFHLLQ